MDTYHIVELFLGFSFVFLSFVRLLLYIYELRGHAAVNAQRRLDVMLEDHVIQMPADSASQVSVGTRLAPLAESESLSDAWLVLIWRSICSFLV